MKVGHKIGLWNMKTKIYQTIKGLNILFIKPLFSIRCNQAFRPLHTSTSSIYLIFSLNPNSLVTYIIPDIFVSFPIWLMISDLHLQKSLHPIKSSLGLRTCQAWGPLVYWPGGFCHFCEYFDVHKKQSWRLHKREVLIASSRAFIYIAIKGCSKVIHITPWQVDDLQES